MRRLGRGDRYCAVREGNVASRLVEPGTPCAWAGGCQIPFERNLKTLMAT
jgi:hypothetical protein